MHSEFVRHVATLMAGRSSALLISFLLTPVIARLFVPEDFGSAAFFAAAIAMVGSAGSLNYQRAAILQSEDSEAEGLLILSLQILTLVVMLMYAGLGVARFISGSSPFNEMLGLWVWLLPLGIWVYAAAEIMMSALNREKAYKAISVSDVGQVVSTTGVRIGAGFAFGSSMGGLVLGYLFGSIVRLFGLRAPGWHIGRLVHRLFDRCGQVRLAREYREFPLLNTPAAVAKNLSTSLPIFVLGMMYSPAIAGLYAMADRLIKVPVTVSGHSIRRVYLRKIAILRSEGKPVTASYWKVVRVLAISGLLPLLVLWFWGEEIITIVLGDTWRDAGNYAEILAPFFYSLWVTTIVPPTMIAFRRQGLWMLVQISALFARGGVFAVAYWMLWEPEAALNAFVWVNVVVGVIMLMVAHWVMALDKS